MGARVDLAPGKWNTQRLGACQRADLSGRDEKARLEGSARSPVVLKAGRISVLKSFLRRLGLTPPLAQRFNEEPELQTAPEQILCCRERKLKKKGEGPGSGLQKKF